jgi:hypothetical protein
MKRVKLYLAVLTRMARADKLSRTYLYTEPENW